MLCSRSSSLPSSTGLPSTADNVENLSAHSSAYPSSISSPENLQSSSPSTASCVIRNHSAGMKPTVRYQKRKLLKRQVEEAIKGWDDIEEFPDGLHSFWSKMTHVFLPTVDVSVGDGFSKETFEPLAAQRLRRLKCIHQDIQKTDWEATRIWLVFLAHEVEYISRWEYLHTSRGIDVISAALAMAEKYFKSARTDWKRSKAYVRILTVGGPGMLLKGGEIPYSMWEQVMSKSAFDDFFARVGPSHNRSNELASHAMMTCLEGYGWSRSRFLDSGTNVMRALKPYLHPPATVDHDYQALRNYGSDREILNYNGKRPHVDDRRNQKSWCGTPVSLPDHDVRDLTRDDSNCPSSVDVQHRTVCIDPAAGRIGSAINQRDAIDLEAISRLDRVPAANRRGPAVTGTDDPSYRLSAPGSFTSNPKEFHGTPTTFTVPQLLHPPQHLSAYNWEGRQPTSGMSIDHAITSSTVPGAVSPTFQELDSDTRDLAMILTFLGEAEIPGSMVLRAGSPKCFVNQFGKVDNTEVLRPFGYQDTCAALQSLASLAFVHIDERGSIRVQSKLRSITESMSGPARQNMQYRASLLVFHSFPVDPDVETELFGILGLPQLLHVQHVLKYFDTPDFGKKFSLQQLEQIILVCLSASKFGDHEWKWRVLRAAKKILGTDKAYPYLLQKLQLRKMVLGRLHRRGPENLLARLASTFPTFSKEVSLFRAQLLIDDDELSQAWHELESWDQRESDLTLNTSKRVLQMKTCLQARICRFAGDFAKAKSLFQSIGVICMSVAPNYLSEYVATMCESQEFEEAMSVSRASFVDAKAGVVGRRPSYVHGSVCLMKALWSLKGGGCDYYLLEEAKRIYVDLNGIYLRIMKPGLASSIRHFSVSAGLAMIAHVEWRCKQAVTPHEVLEHWQNALLLGHKSAKYFGGTSFPEMIIPYSMCELTHHLGLCDQTAQYMDRSKLLFQTTGRQFQYPALGSVWFDLIQEWNMGHGLSLISKLSFEDYMEQQKKWKFSYEEKGSRLCK